MAIDYVALSFQGENDVKYQIQLQPVDKDWSAPSEQRSVNYARLAPGSYRLLVRAINQDGVMSPEPATFEFRVLAPFWQRWWFITAVAILTGLLIYSLYRRRVARLIEIEKVRTRIATDLHDDIGASLSLIAMLSEVARRQARQGDIKMNEALSSIASSSRELVDSMSDIVWAVNPRKDRLSELTKRMRRFASDVLSSRNIVLRFSAPDQDHDLKIGADTRREIFFILKEGVNNMARHSACTEADISLKTEAGWLTLELRDNGRGFDPSRADEGNGLVSMRERAHKLGGELQIISANGEGTNLRLRVPLTGRTWKIW